MADMKTTEQWLLAAFARIESDELKVNGSKLDRLLFSRENVKYVTQGSITKVYNEGAVVPSRLTAGIGGGGVTGNVATESFPLRESLSAYESFNVDTPEYLEWKKVDLKSLVPVNTISDLLNSLSNHIRTIKKSFITSRRAEMGTFLAKLIDDDGSAGIFSANEQIHYRVLGKRVFEDDFATNRDDKWAYNNRFAAPLDEVEDLMVNILETEKDLNNHFVGTHKLDFIFTNFSSNILAKELHQAQTIDIKTFNDVEIEKIAMPTVAGAGEYDPTKKYVMGFADRHYCTLYMYNWNEGDDLDLGYNVSQVEQTFKIHVNSRYEISTISPLGMFLIELI